ncbi:tRNA lysidine(34) synthetase TilS [Patescibacteria group bacterium]|nr:MAG: tRNA lysidine(34) synthetase TilS [Patescibacteria group bacterium]
MNIRVEPGTWVVAVSGGVDSMVLLDLVHQLQLRRPDDYTFTVAHFDHGIRPDSSEDRRLVQQQARTFRLPFVYEEAHLGAGTSEAVAREARYAFLERVCQAVKAQGIMTAHHQDDVLETAAHHLLRGTGRRGVSALTEHLRRSRPLLAKSKRRLQEYARSHDVQWREDSTNQDLRYTRNYIRHQVLAKSMPAERAQLIAIINKTQELNQEIDELLANTLHMQPHARQLSRRWFIGLPHAVAREVLYAWFRTHNIQGIQRAMIERAVIAIKTGRSGKCYGVDKHHTLLLSKSVAELTDRSTPQLKRKSV